jgi:hypothetical protein
VGDFIVPILQTENGKSEKVLTPKRMCIPELALSDLCLNLYFVAILLSLPQFFSPVRPSFYLAAMAPVHPALLWPSVQSSWVLP